MTDRTRMRIFQIFIDISAIFLSFVSIVEMKDFCEAFEENGHKISYGFRRITAKDSYEQYLFIGQYYWKLKYTDDQKDENKKVGLSSRAGLKSNWFGNDYSMAYCVWDSAENECKAMLLSSDQKSIDCAFLEPNKLDTKGVATGVDIPNGAGGRTTFKWAFVPVMNEKDKRYVTFVDPSDRYYDVLIAQMDCSTTNVVDGDLPPDLQPHVLGKMATEDTNNLMAVLGQSTQGKSAMILVFKNISQTKESVFYCIAYPSEEPCDQKDMKELIDCKNYRQHTIPDITTTMGPEGSSGLIWIVIAIIAILLLIAAIAAILWWFWRNSKTEEPSAQPSAASATGPSAVSQMPSTAVSQVRSKKL